MGSPASALSKSPTRKAGCMRRSRKWRAAQAATGIHHRRDFRFRAAERAGAPRIALVEAGTGTGKTLGYLAPASLGRRRTAPALDFHLHPQPAAPDPAGDREALSRSGRAQRKGGRAQGPRKLSLPAQFRRGRQAHGARAGTTRVALALIARWIATNTGRRSFRCGLSRRSSPRRCRCASLTDRRGECVYAACPHYRTCFIERACAAPATRPS